jgi:catechol-2,3-dioxygenase
MSQIPTTISFVGAVPQFTVPDLVRTAEYYRDVLGFQIAAYWDGERVSLDPDTSPVFAIIDGSEARVYGQRELVVKDCNGLILAFGEDISGSRSGSS